MYKYVNGGSVLVVCVGKRLPMKRRSVETWVQCVWVSSVAAWLKYRHKDVLDFERTTSSTSTRGSRADSRLHQLPPESHKGYICRTLRHAYPGSAMWCTCTIIGLKGPLLDVCLNLQKKELTSVSRRHVVSNGEAPRNLRCVFTIWGQN